MAKSIARGKALVAKLRADPKVRDAEALAAELGRRKALRHAAKKARGKVGKGARQFKELGDSESWGNEHYSKWADGLSPDTKAFIQSYKGSAHATINRDLQENGGDANATPDHIQEHIKPIDAALNSAPPLKEPITVFRGGLPTGVTDAFDVGAEDGLANEVFGDDGYVSTSLLPRVADSFAEKGRGGQKPAGANITLPKGAKAAFIDAEGLTPAINLESEMLLPRGSRFRVNRAYRRDGVPWVDAVLIPA